MEYAVCAGTDCLIAEHTSRRDNADGRFVVFHDPYLHRRGMGSECHLLFAFLFLYEESVLHVSGWMVWWEIECREKVPIIFYLNRFSHSKAYPREYLSYLVHHHRKHMTAAQRSKVGGHGQVASTFLFLVFFYERLKFFNLVHCGHLKHVKGLTQLLFLFVGNDFELFKEFTDNTFLPQVFVAEHLNFRSLILEFLNVGGVYVVNIRLDFVF